MEWISVSSSMMSKIKYDKDASVLDIEWHGGRTFRYFDVSRDEFANLIHAESKSQYFFEEMKSKYRCVQIS